LFKEFCRSGSGHPSSDAYGWVWNDDKNLYFNMDFTGDNTFDGLKDYARVFIKTDGKIKEFVMSVGETRYGEPGFTYTDKVAYQHKVYPFTIPLSEISDSDPKNIEMAFSGYGTLAAQDIYGVYYEALLDTGSGGGDVIVGQSGGNETFSGVDYRVGVVVQYVFTCDEPFDGGCEGDWVCPVNAIDNFIRKWNGTNFVDNTVYGENNYPIAGRFGNDNTMAAEFYVPIADIDNYDGMFTGIFHASTLASASDFTSPFEYGQSLSSIPTMTEWGMLILILVLMIGAIRALKNNRCRNAAICVLLICCVAGVAWAATIIIDGNTNDWSGIQPIVADVAGDSSSLNSFLASNEDIRWGYVTSDNNNLYFRIDYTGSTEYPLGDVILRE
jgi:hypothetical protein